MVQIAVFTNGTQGQVDLLPDAVRAVPKSGEVWCEAARVALNPVGPFFNLDAAARYLALAYRFTPQHSDSLIEMVRLEMLAHGLDAACAEVRRKLIASEGVTYGTLFAFARQLSDRPVDRVFDEAVNLVRGDIAANAALYQQAIARSSFVPVDERSTLARYEALCAEHSESQFAFGLTSLTKQMTSVNAAKVETNIERTQMLTIVCGSISLWGS